MSSFTLHPEGNRGPETAIVMRGSTNEAVIPSPFAFDQEKGRGASSKTPISAGGETMVEDRSDSPGSGDPSPRSVNGLIWGLVVAAILSSTFLFALDNTIVADVQPQIIGRFGEIGKLPWLSVAFLLGAVSTNLIWCVQQTTLSSYPCIKHD